MKTWLRRIRGAVVVGLTWAVGWGLVGVLVMTLLGAASATGSLALARMGRERGMLEAGADRADN